MSIDLDRDRVEKLSMEIGTCVRDHLMVTGDHVSPARVFEALNALASITALVLAGVTRQQIEMARSWFNEGLDNELPDAIRAGEERWGAPIAPISGAKH